ncbi:MAG: hypothetical protein R3E82_03755 [Pseudomonadales bacterium]
MNTTTIGIDLAKSVIPASLARALLAELDVHLPAGTIGIISRLHLMFHTAPPLLSASLGNAITEITEPEAKLGQIDLELWRLASDSPLAQDLLTIPGRDVTCPRIPGHLR